MNQNKPIANGQPIVDDKSTIQVMVDDEEYKMLVKQIKARKPAFISDQYGVKEKVELRRGVMYEKSTNKKVISKSEILSESVDIQCVSQWGALFTKYGSPQFNWGPKRYGWIIEGGKVCLYDAENDQTVIGEPRQC